MTHLVRAYWLDGVTPLHRIVSDDGLIFDIIAVNYCERRVDNVMEITCKQYLTLTGSEDIG